MKPEAVLAALALAGLAASAGLWAAVRADARAAPAAGSAADVVGAPLGQPLDGAEPDEEPGRAPPPAPSAEVSAQAPAAVAPLGAPAAGVPDAPTSALHHARQGAKRRTERGAVGERREDGVLAVRFEELELVAYEPPDPEATATERAARGDVLPELIRALDGETVSIRGYMSPLEFEDDRVTSFVLSRNLPGCCFGVLPQPDEWIEVDVLAAGGVDYLPFGSVVVTGRLEVGEDFDEYGYLTSLFRLDAESVEEPW